ncbi:MAG: hypothetical protein ACLUPL_10665 [Butyricimonas virosa]
MAGMPSCRIDYTDIPQKSNAPCLRSLLLNYCGYFTNLEISGHLDISSDKYLPAKAVMEYEDGYVMIFEATYDLNPDGTGNRARHAKRRMLSRWKRTAWCMMPT